MGSSDHSLRGCGSGWKRKRFEVERGGLLGLVGLLGWADFLSLFYTVSFFFFYLDFLF